MADHDQSQLSDLEALQLKASIITDATLESTRRMKILVEESESTGIKTIETLEYQGEKLKRVENGLDGMRSDMRQTNNSLKRMEKWCGLLCVCPSLSNSAKSEDKSKESKTDNKKGISFGIGKSRSKKATVPESASKGPYIKRITNDAREDEMEENMEEIGKSLGRLKIMSEVIGDEVTHHSKKIDDIHKKGGRIRGQIEDANERTKKIIK